MSEIQMPRATFYLLWRCRNDPELIECGVRECIRACVRQIREQPRWVAPDRAEGAAPDGPRVI